MTTPKWTVEYEHFMNQFRELPPTEKTVVIRVAMRAVERLKLGLDQYGQFNPTTDTRNWRVERKQESTDGIIYEELEEMVEEAQRG